ncbi:MAG TPA: hypothetical protein VLG76_07830 [Rhabdochlamydiaceae bacterium]|nr:hypothetical protein [Rhabdochlamydiaceae bacterium]
MVKACPSLSELAAEALPEFTHLERALEPYLAPLFIAKIADYAGVLRKIDSAKMIKRLTHRPFCCFKPLLPKNIIRYELRCKTSADGSHFKKSDEKTLMTYVGIYAWFLKTKGLMYTEQPETDDETRKYSAELFDFFSKIKGIERIDCQGIQLDFRCSQYVFQTEPRVLEEANLMYDLFGFIKDNQRYLEKKGYQRLKTAAPGAIVTYSNGNIVKHYGIVDSIDEEGGVIVRSKFGVKPLCRHKLELVEFVYGKTVTFYAKKTENKSDLT